MTKWQKDDLKIIAKNKAFVIFILKNKLPLKITTKLALFIWIKCALVAIKQLFLDRNAIFTKSERQNALFL